MLRGQLFARQGMLVVTEPQERIAGDNAAWFQSQLFRSDPKPLPTLGLVLRVVIVVGKMLVKIRLRPRPILLWYATEHKSPRYAIIRRLVVMNSSQPAYPVSTRLPLIMVETVAPRSQWIAPTEAQSSIILMIRFGSSKMLKVMKHFSGIQVRFLTMETELYAMTLTPPRAVERAAGSRLAGPLVAPPDGKSTGGLYAIG